MSKMGLVFRQEIRQTVMRRSFFISLVLMPLIVGVVFWVINVSSAEDPAANENPLAELVMPAKEALPEGVVDDSGLMGALPEDAQEDLIRYDSEAAARAALDAGEIEAFYVIPPDYLSSGKATYVTSSPNPLEQGRNVHRLETALNAGLIQDETLAARLENPMELEVQTLSEAPQRDADNVMTFLLPYMVAMLFYAVIFSSASLMLNSISTEKENYVMEILMTSVSPQAMMTGKILALGLVGLFQTLVWSGIGFAFTRLAGKAVIPAEFQISPVLLVWGGLFFVSGYALYASFMAGAGALAPNLREASQVTFLVMVPMIIPLMMIGALSQNPDGALSVGLSLFPLTAPVAMMARMAATEVPLWQGGLSLGLVIVSAVLAVRWVGGLFRTQTLLSGQTFNVKLFLRALVGKA
ncbi:ABC transporter permease [Levilinea saccharolytica]|uniref:ABC-2 type transporter transmembrane domain-containing protein n=1 Tax=Levilinea saccharolytica TaxID=229921 RepID=A0A0P6XXI5_9CHLR|nr:ABC transporter permease [Levilinea saccharolytica]KPL80640.1 hypothetical protein ADN01_10880 [Levilinea saccharolytica]GAP17312.1 ABC-type Na+ efflux pump, permease component [Levilinea saccharolytica]